MLSCMLGFLCVSINSYKWLLTEQDAFCWHVSQCHRFNSLWALSSPSRLLSTHKSLNQTPANKHTRTVNAHLLCRHTYTQLRQDYCQKRLVHHDWLSNPHTCANNFLSPGDKGEGEEKREKKTAEDDEGDIESLFIWNIFSEGNKAGEKKILFPSVL